MEDKNFYKTHTGYHMKDLRELILQYLESKLVKIKTTIKIIRDIYQIFKMTNVNSLIAKKK